MAKQSLSAEEVRDITSKFDVSRGGLQALITVTEATAELNADEALPPLHALLMILNEFELG